MVRKTGKVSNPFNDVLGSPLFRIFRHKNRKHYGCLKILVSRSPALMSIKYVLNIEYILTLNVLLSH